MALSGSLLFSNFAYTALDRLTGPLLGSHRRCHDDALSPALIKINSQLNLPPGRWQVAEWVVRDAAFGQGSWVIAQVNLFLTLFINLKETAGQPAREKLLNNPFCQLCINLSAIGGPFHSDIWIQSVDEEDDVFGMLEVDYNIMAIFF